ncbi:MAG: D-aminoacylase, partial [Bacillota bacterium]
MGPGEGGQTPLLDVIVRNGLVVDGTGAPARRTDVGIQGDTVAAIGSLEGCEAGRVLDATGMVVAPGFIDAHGHSDAVLLCDRAYDAKLRQGV